MTNDRGVPTKQPVLGRAQAARDIVLADVFGQSHHVRLAIVEILREFDAMAWELAEAWEARAYDRNAVTAERDQAIRELGELGRRLGLEQEARAALLRASLGLFDALKHGDSEHQAWLKTEIAFWFKDVPELPAIKAGMEVCDE